MPNILLTTVCRPFGGPGEGDSVSAELFHAQVTRAQGIFSFRQVIRCWGLDYIAENISAPSVVLHYPSERELIRELKSRNYDYIGINFVVSTFHKIGRIVPLIRKHAPGAKIILGGYGTVLPDETLNPLCDYICREEGIGYMRRLLGEDTEKPIKHPYAPIASPRFFSHQMKTKVAHITGGLGCPNGCDFCCTSHFFQRRYVPFLKTGRELYDTIHEMQRKAQSNGDTVDSFIVIDEDFFTQKRRAMEFLECVRKGGKVIKIMGFGSVRGLSQFTADEIAEMGFDIIWTAFEGEQAGYQKLKGKPFEELYTSLKARGVTLLSSMIIGFPYQDKKQIMKEFDQLMSLEPTLAQILIYFAFPGTPLYKQVMEEDRYLPQYKENPDYRRWDGFSMHFKHPNFTATELEKIQKDLYRQDFERLGPSIVRANHVWFEGYKNLRNSENPLLKQRAQSIRDYVRDSVPGIYVAAIFGPNKERRAEAKRFLKEIEDEMGKYSLVERLMCSGAVILAIWTWLTMRLNIYQQPALFKVERGMQLSNRKHLSLNNLKGALHSKPFSALLEDLLCNLKWTWRRIFA